MDLQLPGRRAVLVQEIDLNRPVGVGKLGQAAGAEHQRHVSKRLTVHGDVVE